MNYKHIIWDWNGTIVNDAAFCVNLVNIMLSNFRIPSISLEYYLNNFSFPVKNYYELIGLPVDDNSYESISNSFIGMYRENFRQCQLQDGILQVLKKLSKFGISQSILSAGQYDDLLVFIKYYKLESFFNIISGVNNNKASGKASISSNHFKNIDYDQNEVLLIGDTLHDYEISLQLGIDCLLVSYGHNSFSVLSDSKNSIVQNATEILNWVID